jgi:predicted aconitase with swiveling domain
MKQNQTGIQIQGRVVVDGKTRATVRKSDEPLSFWGGYDQATGEIIDRRHPLSGVIGAGCIVAIPFTRGSSTTTSILIEAVRAGVAPAGIITTEVDSFLALASIVADEMYEASFPVLSVDQDAFDSIADGATVEIQRGGKILVNGPAGEKNDE